MGVAPKKGRSEPTVTFQPESDVAEILREIKKLGRREQGRRINEAVRVHHKHAAMNIALRELDVAKAKVRRLGGDA